MPKRRPTKTQEHQNDMHAASPPNPNHAIRFQPCSTQSLQRDDNREHNAQISSSSSSRRRRCHQPCSRHAYAPSFAGRTASAPLCTQRLPLPTPLDPSFERLAPPPLSAGCAQSKMSSCECGLFNLACGPPPRPGPTTFGVLCYQNEYCDWCTSLRVHFSMGIKAEHSTDDGAAGGCGATD
jgi:hypothetical protein